ncbi:hypothetical protein RE6C_00015 [Rhodopirellula europaea 6C]|uniref:Uncharacterized protein n=1 Tax=Rhodopirellula europaea 6C TaxID=1263867 RepID=M2AA77_9BACT|nr:hypothetical protein RE6C_00015 [Rhodopirellula europaea 6C]
MELAESPPENTQAAPHGDVNDAFGFPQVNENQVYQQRDVRRDSAVNRRQN